MALVSPSEPEATTTSDPSEQPEAAWPEPRCPVENVTTAWRKKAEASAEVLISSAAKAKMLVFYNRVRFVGREP